MKLAIALTLYAAALFLIWIGIDLAPAMTWPHTDLELAAAAMMTLGSIAKLAGHVVLLSLTNAR